jgi:hypothetical protein
VVPGVLNQTQGLLRQYGLFGDLVHVASIGAVFAGSVYVIIFDMSGFTFTDQVPRMATERKYLMDFYSRFRS